MSKPLKKWTLISAVLAALVYIDIYYLFSLFYITIPLAVLSAAFAIMISFIQKQYVIAFLNFFFAFMAVISFIIIP